MTKLERKTVEQIISAIENPSIGATEYVEGQGRKELRPHAEAMRLLDSADFKTGYKECAEVVTRTLKWLLTEEDKLKKRGQYSRPTQRR